MKLWKNNIYAILKQKYRSLTSIFNHYRRYSQRHFFITKLWILMSLILFRFPDTQDSILKSIFDSKYYKSFQFTSKNFSHFHRILNYFVEIPNTWKDSLWFRNFEGISKHFHVITDLSTRFCRISIDSPRFWRFVGVLQYCYVF